MKPYVWAYSAKHPIGGFGEEIYCDCSSMVDEALENSYRTPSLNPHLSVLPTPGILEMQRQLAN